MYVLQGTRNPSNRIHMSWNKVLAKFRISVETIYNTKKALKTEGPQVNVTGWACNIQTRRIGIDWYGSKNQGLSQILQETVDDFKNLEKQWYNIIRVEI